MPHSGIKNRLLSVAAEEQARRKTFQPYYKAFERICQDDYKKLPQMRQAQGVLQVSRALLLCSLLPQDLRGNKRLIFPKDNEQISLFDMEE